MWEQTFKNSMLWLGWVGFVLGLIFLLTYRYCEQAGSAAQKACIAAILAATAGGIVAFWPLFKTWSKKRTTGIAAVMIGNMIRVLVGFVGVVIVLLFTEVSRTWFLGCFGIFYTAFLLTGSWLMLRLLCHRGLKEDESEYEQLRDIACQHESTRRNYE